jgi:hypothetical protein
MKRCPWEDLLMTTENLTAQIADQWTVGSDRNALLPMLTRTGEDCGFSRQEVSGSKADFEAAIAVCESLRATVAGHEKSSLTAVIKRLQSAVKHS